MGAAVWFAHRWLSEVVGTSNDITRAIALGGAIAAGLVVLAAAAKLLRLWEFEEAMKAIIGRIRGGRAVK
jgi:Pyruvate/2-oxoacid:ferredoxin oxidoreductase gamma subunit